MKQIDNVVAQRVWRRVQASSGGTVGDWPLRDWFPAEPRKPTPTSGSNLLLWWLLLVAVCVRVKN